MQGFVMQTNTTFYVQNGFNCFEFLLNTKEEKRTQCAM